MQTRLILCYRHSKHTPKAMPGVNVAFSSLLTPLVHQLVLHQPCTCPLLPWVTLGAHRGGRKEIFFFFYQGSLRGGLEQKRAQPLADRVWLRICVGHKGNVLAKAGMNLMREPKRLLRNTPLFPPSNSGQMMLSVEPISSDRRDRLLLCVLQPEAGLHMEPASQDHPAAGGPSCFLRAPRLLRASHRVFKEETKHCRAFVPHQEGQKRLEKC